MKKVLVTGGAGFIGSHLVDGLLLDGWDVTSVDNFDEFYSRRIKEQNIAGHLIHPGFRLVEADIRDWQEVKVKLTGPYDVVVHLAAKAGVRPSIERPRLYQDVNVMGTQNILELARACAVKQFVFASSSSVYGENPNVPWREDDPVLRPISPYAATKVAGELIGHVYSRLYGMRFIALRFFTVYGPRQRPDLAIHKFARLILAGEPITLFGNGLTRRDYTYIDDIVRGVRSAMEYDASSFEVLNLGHSDPVGLQELLLHLESVLQKRAIVEHLPTQAGDVPQTYADTTKAKRLLGYCTGTPFVEGLRQFAAWLNEANV